MLGQPALATPRLPLRPPAERDIPAIIAIAGNLEVARQLARVPHPYGEPEARFFLDHVVPSERVWAITLRGDDTLIGTIGLTPPANRTAELGYWLSPAHWNRGRATEAARAVIDHAFATLDLASIKASHFTTNPASARILAKLGFRPVGETTIHCLATGQNMASVMMHLPAPGQPPSTAP